MSWSEKYKKSIDCSSPRGFSQKAHCQGRKKRNENNMKLSELKEMVRQVVKEAGPSHGFNKLASIYQKEALKHQDMVKDQKRLAAAFVAEKDPKKKEKVKKEILNHHQKVKAQEKKMKEAEYDMMNALNKEKIEFEESVNESKLSFSKLKKGQVLLNKFRSGKKYNIIDVDSKSATLKNLQTGKTIVIHSLNNYELKESVNEAKRSVVHKAVKGGNFPVSLVVIKNGKVIDQELVNTPMEVPAAFNVIQSKHKGATIHIEDKTGKRLFSENLNEGKEPEIITQLRDVMKSGYKTLKDPKSGKRMKVDSYTASAIVGVYDKLINPSNQEKFAKQGLLGMQSLAFKLLK